MAHSKKSKRKVITKNMTANVVKDHKMTFVTPKTVIKQDRKVRNIVNKPLKVHHSKGSRNYRVEIPVTVRVAWGIDDNTESWVLANYNKDTDVLTLERKHLKEDYR